MKTAQLTSQSRRAALAIAVLCLAVTSQAQLITNDPSFPPLGGTYVNPEQVFATYGSPALQIFLSQVQLVPLSIDSRITQGANEIETFQSNLDGNGNVLQGGVPIFNGPVQAMGLVQTILLGKAGNTTGTFQTEMLSLNLSGVTPIGPFLIRESPTLPSLGVTSITDIGGGQFLINSFFDVFTEISIDGGATFMPDTTGPARLQLVPEPTSLSLLALGLTGLLGCARRRQ